MDHDHNPSTTANPPSRFPEAPAPWILKGEAYWFITSVFGRSTPSITPSYFDLLEAQSAKLATEPGAFKGGVGMAVVMRYTESPVGAYDELLIVPGAFTSPKFDKDKENIRITRIYVSTLASLYNGRKNWNTAKHLAKFEFMKGPSGTVIRVFPLVPLSPEDTTTFSDQPCFAASVTLSWMPAIPYDTRITPFTLDIVQPPIEASPQAEINGLVGTDHWTKFLPVYKGKVKTFTSKGLLEGDEYGDDVYFPKFSPWRIGVHWPECLIDFPASKTLTEETSEDPVSQ
ncbi:hypothetical protein FS842_008627 [Serendipita sp. 407]|nr:hypothetical protein FS842_008627 [Serendipita sp. 407]